MFFLSLFSRFCDEGMGTPGGGDVSPGVVSHNRDEVSPVNSREQWSMSDIRWRHLEPAGLGNIFLSRCWLSH